MVDYYKVLLIPPTASTTEIKASFKKLALQYHPDRNPNNLQAEEKFKEINEAYQVLSDPDKRATYDFLLRYGFQLQQEQEAQQSQRRPRTYYKGKKVRPEARKVRFLYFYIFAGFTVFIVLGFFFFSFMETQAARTMLSKAKEHYYINHNSFYALKFLEGAVTKDEGLSEAYYLTGKILFNEGQNNIESLYNLDKAIYTANNLEDSVGNYYLLRGKVNMALHKTDNAVSDFKEAFNLLPDNSELQRKLAELYLYKLQNFDEALMYYDKLLNKAPKDYDALVGKGVCLQKKREYQKSLSFLEEAKNEKQSNGEALYYLGWHALNFKSDSIEACNYWNEAKVKGVRQAEVLIEKYCSGI
ncbi:tetratricopeptide repeat protein [Chondrinema litorale]|uniref:tetratricopeptide repeat protein n=1 Tax=Chondrinema litorale TaxID=2994555 RepID=UPI0025429EF4|nr:DnaJ domain-containing protein [Chondrinema litorale]